MLNQKVISLVYIFFSLFIKQLWKNSRKTASLQVAIVRNNSRNGHSLQDRLAVRLFYAQKVLETVSNYMYMDCLSHLYPTKIDIELLNFGRFKSAVTYI
jgi:hypothetical protein